jgi:hypothetical protein
MPLGNSYPAPSLPLNGTEQVTLFQQQGALVVTCTCTVYDLTVTAITPSLSSPPPIGNGIPNTGAFTTLSATGALTVGQDETIAGYVANSVVSGIVATGTTQSTAFNLAAQINIVTNVAANTGVVLPTYMKSGANLIAGTVVRIVNRGANTLNVYPNAGTTIEALGINNPAAVAPNGSAEYIYVGSSQWYVQ